LIALMVFVTALVRTVPTVPKNNLRTNKLEGFPISN
jgi:hypothetical protein